MYFYDLETTFLARGSKRKDQQILEVGIVSGRRAYKKLVDPVGDYPLLDRLEHLGQHPERTVNFWTKLLIGKGILNSAVKRKSLEDKAKAIDRVRGDFATPDQAVQGMIDFGIGTWVAHNGKAFDHKIIQAHFDRMGVAPKVIFADSLPQIRKLNLPSHSLSHVYKHLFKTPFRAHHALDDAIALQKVCRKLNITFAEKTSLRTLDGVGPKREQVFRSAGIHSVEDLREWVRKHTIDEWKFKLPRALSTRIFNLLR